MLESKVISRRKFLYHRNGYSPINFNSCFISDNSSPLVVLSIKYKLNVYSFGKDSSIDKTLVGKSVTSVGKILNVKFTKENRNFVLFTNNAIYLFEFNEKRTINKVRLLKKFRGVDIEMEY